MKFNCLHSFIPTLVILTGAVQACASGDFAKDQLKEDGTATSDRPVTDGDSKPADVDEVVFKGLFHLTVTGRNQEKILCEDKNARITVTVENVDKVGDAICSDSRLQLAGIKSISIASKPEEKTINVKQIDVPKLKDGLGNPLDDRVRYAYSKGDTKFVPALPRHIGPIIQDPNSYMKSDGTFLETVVNQLKATRTPTDPKDEFGVQEDVGSVRMKIEDINGTFTSPVNGKVYKNVLTYSVSAEGFDKIEQKADADLYTKITYRWQTGSTDVESDLRLLSVEITGPVTDFRSGTVAFVGGWLLFGGQMNISLNLIESESDD